MQLSVKTYKRKFDKDLKHIKIILVGERRRLSIGEWLDLVRKTHEWMHNEPEHFFGGGLPPEEILHEAIDMVFQDFLEDQRLLANQTNKRFAMPKWSKWDNDAKK